MKSSSVLSCVGILMAATGSAQSHVFNFQQVNVVDGFSPDSVSNSGAICGNYWVGSQYRQGIWTAQTGLVPFTNPGDSYDFHISPMGRVYGYSNGAVVKFDAVNGKSVIASGTGTFEPVANQNDYVLIRQWVGSAKTYYRYHQSTGLQTLNLPSNGLFSPTSVGADGTIYGFLQSGVDPFGQPARMYSRLNPDGTTTIMPHAVVNYYHGDQFSHQGVTQYFDYLSTGVTVVTTVTDTGSTSSSNTITDSAIYLPDGVTHYNLTSSSYSSHIGGSSSGNGFTTVLNDGFAVGSHVNPDVEKLLFDLGNPNGVEFGASNYAPGSLIPEKIRAGTHEGTLVGIAQVNGQWKTYLSTIPEPSSFAVLGLGLLALRRRRKK